MRKFLGVFGIALAIAIAQSATGARADDRTGIDEQFLIYRRNVQLTPQPFGIFSTEQAAQEHCPGDAVVWFDTRARVVYDKSDLAYGHTSDGAYACRRDTRNVADIGFGSPQPARPNGAQR